MLLFLLMAIPLFAKIVISFGSGVIMYVPCNFSFRIIGADSVTSLGTCENEILAVMFPVVNLILIAVYHPFWKDSLRNEQTISCVIDINQLCCITARF